MPKPAKPAKRSGKTAQKSPIYKVAEAKARLSELLARVEGGEDVVIARGDKAVARLVPIDERARRRSLIDEILAERDRGNRKPVTVEEIIAWKHEGHRF